MVRKPQRWWMVATMLFAALFVAAGMTLSRAQADAAPAPAATARPTAVPTPDRTIAAITPQPQPAAAPATADTSATDADPTQGYVIHRVLDVKGPMRPGDYYWNEAGAPADGPVVITADLKAQTISVFRAGYEIGTAVILYGADDKPTPTGIFPITQKKAKHVSTLYDAPMPYMQRLTNDGVAIHGTPRVGQNLATHGCIGVPNAFAKLLFGVTRLGDKVIVTNGEMLQAGRAITAIG